MKVKGYNLRIGDVIRIDFGGEDYSITLIVDAIVIRIGEDMNLNVCGHYPNSNRMISCYGKSDNDVEVIERGRHE